MSISRPVSRPTIPTTRASTSWWRATTPTGRASRASIHGLNPAPPDRPKGKNAAATNMAAR